MNLSKLRKKIDKIDSKIVSLLNERAGTSLDIRRTKSKQKKTIYSPEREQQVLKRLSHINRGPLENSSLEAIYREVMSSSLSLEKPIRIAYLGPEATFTHLAALKRFGSQVDYRACNTITDVFLDVEKLNADYGVVPIENSTEGAVSHTLDMLVDSDLKICAQIVLEISHNLLAQCTKQNIKKVYSNANALGQCRIWLNRNLPKVDYVEVSSTTRAAQICAKQKKSACIASILAAKMYGLRVVGRGIEDSSHNITRFLVIGQADCPQTKNDRTSIVFSIKDRVGALHDMLMLFKKNKINLTKIESRPSKKKAWDYYFFVDLEGHRLEKKVLRALNQLEGQCKLLKILGSYPV
ncbi:prephenate dehydratase [Candidatus Omnitrophota bacterium]